MKVKKTTNFLAILFLISYLFSCEKGNENKQIIDQDNSELTEIKSPYKTTGSIERLSDKLDDLIPEDAQLEILASGFTWSEGPLWLETENKLIFSDVPENKIYQWIPGDTVASIYLEPSGFTSSGFHGGEMGANGLILDADNKLILCQHGDRQLARMTSPISQPSTEYESIANNWEGKKFNSPNDVVLSSSGIFYFTDPPYGLPKLPEGVSGDPLENNPAKEISFEGVYSVKNGEVELQANDVERPNGILLSPDESKIYLANSDPNRPIWMVYDFTEEGDFTNGQIFFDASELAKQAAGLPDGMKADDKGNIFATGPGGVLVFSPEGEHLGTIKTGNATANCAFNDDYSILYITADMHLMRLILKPKA